MAQSRLIQKTCVALAVVQTITLNTSDAATFRVTNGFDAGDRCTMREALALVNLGQVSFPPQNGCFNLSTDPIGTNDTIEFSVSSITDLSDTLEITNDVTINPSGGLVTFLGNSNDRVFKINSATVSMNSVSIRNGLADDGNANNDPENVPADNGGGVFITADITMGSRSTLTLSNSTVTGNSANRNGGGIYSTFSALILDNSTVSSNSVNNQGGALYASFSTVNIDNINLLDNDANSGAGIFATNSAIVEVSNSLISQNRASDGGGGAYSINNASVKLIDTTISKNTASGSGGGVIVNSDGYLSVERTALLGNSSDLGFGDALSLQTGHIEVSNSTISNNEAAIGGGIGVFNPGSSTVATLKLLNTTISENVGSHELGGQGGGIFALALGDTDISMTNTIISGNSSDFGPQDIRNDSGALIVSNGFNLIGDSSLTNTESFDFTLNPNDITATSPRSYRVSSNH